MTMEFNPKGPFYLEVIYENEGASDAGEVLVGFVDEFTTEESAWAATDHSATADINAVTLSGDPVQIARNSILQFVIAKSAGENSNAPITA